MAFDVTSLRAAFEAEIAGGDTCTVTRQEGGETHDPDTGVAAFVDPPTVLYDALHCLIDEMSTRAKVLAGFPMEVEIFDVVLPWSATGIRKGDVLTMTAARDPELADVAFQVNSTYGAGTSAVSRRVGAVRVGAAQLTVGD